MNEQTYLKEIEKMREAGLCRTSPASARIYASQLKAGTPLSMAAAADGVCGEEKGLLDLEEKAELDRLNRWQAEQNLSDKERAALKLLLKIHQVEPISKRTAALLRKKEAAQEQGATTLKQMTLKEYGQRDRETELPVSLYGVLSALRQATKNRRQVAEEPAYTLVMRALLLDEGFYWNSDLTEQELRPGGSHYEDNIRIIAANLQDQTLRQAVKQRLQDALLELEDQWDGPQMRIDVGRVCGYLKKEMECCAASGRFAGSAMEALLGRMASMEKGVSGFVYQSLPAEELTENVMDLLLLGIEAADGNWQPAEPYESRKERLGTEARALLAVVGSGLPVGAAIWRRREWQPALLSLLEQGVLVPDQDGKGLTVAFDVETEGFLPLWEAIETGSSAGTKIWNLFEELLDACDPAELEEWKQDKIRSDLRQLLTKMSLGERRRIPVLCFLTSVFWRRLQGNDGKKAAAAGEWMLRRMKREPDAMKQAFAGVMPGGDKDREVRFTQRSGVSLFEGELLCQCAGIYLQLAMEEHERQEYWAACAVARAVAAKSALQTLGAEELVMEACLTEALARCLEGNGAIGLRKSVGLYDGKTVMSNFVIPAAEALQEAGKTAAAFSEAQQTQAEGLLQQVREGCRIQLFGQDAEAAAVGSRLKESEGWAQMRLHTALSAADCQWIVEEGAAAYAGTGGSEDSGLLSVLMKKERSSKLFLPWYCNTFDSTLVSGPACTQERTEASMLQILLSGQKVTLSLNQVVDNESVRNLTEIPAFLWMVRRGLVSVSFFGGLGSLKEYAVTRMRNPGFVWSSLPEDFGQKEVREAAACWLEGSGALRNLPEEHRLRMVKMRDALERMDENLEVFWNGWFDQNDPGNMELRGIRPMVGLPERLAAYYGKAMPVEDFSKMRALNDMMLAGKSVSNRSDYRQIIWAIQREDLTFLREKGMSPEAMEKAGIPVDALAAEGSAMLENMIRISDECHNRMLGERISPYQYYVYDKETACLLPEWGGKHRAEAAWTGGNENSAGPAGEGGCMLYRQLETGPGEDLEREWLIDWTQAAERIQDLEKLSAEMPHADGEQLCNRLVNQGLDGYSVFGMGGSLRLQKLAFRASTGSAMKRELHREGNLYQEEKGD